MPVRVRVADPFRGGACLTGTVVHVLPGRSDPGATLVVLRSLRTLAGRRVRSRIRTLFIGDVVGVESKEREMKTNEIEVPLTVVSAALAEERERLSAGLRRLADRLDWSYDEEPTVDADAAADALRRLAEGEDADRIGDAMGLPESDPDDEAGEGEEP